MPLGYIHSLDGLRAVSILLVLVGHTGVSDSIPGGFGVTVFFFLSGFLITTLLQQEYLRDGSISMPRFYARRVIRLMPPLLLTILASILLVLTGLAQGQLDAMTLFSQIFFIFNYYSVYGEPLGIDGLGVLWSLSVEEHFYFVWPTIFVLLMSRRLRLAHIFGMLLAFLAWRYVRVYGFEDSEWTIYILTDTRFDSLLFGCLLAILQTRYPEGMRLRTEWMYTILGLSVMLLLLTFIIRDAVFRSTLRYSLQGLALMPIFHFAVTVPKALVFQPLNWAPMRRLGVWSYSVYLVHFVIIHVMQAHGFDPQNRLLFALFVLLLSCLWAALVYELAEKPLHKLRRRLSAPLRAAYT